MKKWERNKNRKKKSLKILKNKFMEKKKLDEIQMTD